MSRSRSESIEVEVMVEGGDEVGEGPVWLGSEQLLVWVDITRNLVHRLDPATN